MGGLGGDVFCCWPYGAPAPQERSCADCTVFAGDYFWQRVGHVYTLSDHVDWLPLSCFSACLFPAHRYTTFEMASLLWLNSIIPISTKSLSPDAESGQVFFSDLLASRIAIRIFTAADLSP